jgi:hypothetical protein
VLTTTTKGTVVLRRPLITTATSFPSTEGKSYYQNTTVVSLAVEIFTAMVCTALL